MSEQVRVDNKTNDAERAQVVRHGITPKLLERKLADHTIEATAAHLDVPSGFLRLLIDDWGISCAQSRHIHRESKAPDRTRLHIPRD